MTSGMRLAISRHSRVSPNEDGIVLLNVERGIVYSGNRAARDIVMSVMADVPQVEIASRLSEAYDIPPAQAVTDTREFLAQLQTRGFLA